MPATIIHILLFVLSFGPMIAQNLSPKGFSEEDQKFLFCAFHRIKDDGFPSKQSEKQWYGNRNPETTSFFYYQDGPTKYLPFLSPFDKPNRHDSTSSDGIFIYRPVGVIMCGPLVKYAYLPVIRYKGKLYCRNMNYKPALRAIIDANLNDLTKEDIKQLKKAFRKSLVMFVEFGYAHIFFYEDGG